MTEGEKTKAKREAELEAELRAMDDHEFLYRMVTDTDISEDPYRVEILQRMIVALARDEKNSMCGKLARMVVERRSKPIDGTEKQT